jgi:hypothetical protein
MISGSKESLNWVAATLKEYPDAVFTFNRKQNEGCFETALRLRKIKLLQLAVMTLVDGSLDAENEKQSILTTDIPDEGRLALNSMVKDYPPEFTVAVLQSMTFIKVPFTRQHLLTRDHKMTCGSSTYLDPWKNLPFVDPEKQENGKTVRTAAVLPIPGLGTMSFLSALVQNAPAEAFDNEAMAGENFCGGYQVLTKKIGPSHMFFLVICSCTSRNVEVPYQEILHSRYDCLSDFLRTVGCLDR